MQSMAERSTRQTLLTLRRVEERAALRALADARRAVEQAERARTRAETKAREAEARRTAPLSVATTAGGLARREAHRGRLRQAAQEADAQHRAAARTWQAAERAFDAARRQL